jgi:O-antigen/teichoic acid export membrane protein
MFYSYLIYVQINEVMFGYTLVFMESLYRILKWSEKYTKTDMIYLFKNSFWVFFGQLVTSASAFIIMVVLANVLDKEIFGEYRYLISFISILLIFTLPGIDTAVIQSTARGYDNQLSLAVASKKRWALLGSLIALLTAVYYYIQGNSTLTLSFTIIAACLPFFHTYFVYYYFLQGKQLFREATLKQSIGPVLLLLTVSTAAFYLPYAPLLILVFLATNVFAHRIGFSLTDRKYKKANQTDDDLIPYGKHLSLLSVPGIIVNHIDKILIWLVLGAVPTALYSIATIVPLESIRSGRMLAQVALPRFAAQKTKPKFKEIFYKLAILFGVLILVWIGYALIAPYIFLILFPGYLEAIPYSIVSMLIILSIPIYTIRAIFTSHKYKTGLFVSSVITPPLKTLFLGTGLIFYGLWGVVIGLVLGSIIETIVNIYLLFRLLNEKVS